MNVPIPRDTVVMGADLLQILGSINGFCAATSSREINVALRMIPLCQNVHFIRCEGLRDRGFQNLYSWSAAGATS
jgi:hypothetical protein